MKLNIMEIEERLALLPIDEVESINRFSNEYSDNTDDHKAKRK